MSSSGKKVFLLLVLVGGGSGIGIMLSCLLHSFENWWRKLRSLLPMNNDYFKFRWRGQCLLKDLCAQECRREGYFWSIRFFLPVHSVIYMSTPGSPSICSSFYLFRNHYETSSNIKRNNLNLAAISAGIGVLTPFIVRTLLLLLLQEQEASVVGQNKQPSIFFSNLFLARKIKRRSV